MNPPHPGPLFPSPSTRPSILERFLPGSRRSLAGWRLLAFVILSLLALVVLVGIEAAILRPTRAPTRVQLTETTILLGEAPLAMAVLVAAFIMGKIERRPFGAYGLPWANAFGGRFWEGAVWGFAALGGLVAVLVVSGSLTLGSAGFAWRAAVGHGALWGAAFFVVALFEEFAFRGYALAALAEGIGFWPAALLLSLAFAAIHLTNRGETPAGLLQAFCIAIFFCFTLRRTGSLWFAMGLHAAWDWGETFFYGVPDSGLVASHHLLNSAARGPAWLSGGSVGPEGSILSLVVVAVLWLLASRRFRQVRFPMAAAVPADSLPAATTSI